MTVSSSMPLCCVLLPFDFHLGLTDSASQAKQQALILQSLPPSPVAPVFTQVLTSHSEHSKCDSHWATSPVSFLTSQCIVLALLI